MNSGNKKIKIRRENEIRHVEDFTQEELNEINQIQADNTNRSNNETYDMENLKIVNEEASK